MPFAAATAVVGEPAPGMVAQAGVAIWWGFTGEPTVRTSWGMARPPP
ncbi:MAG: hypothetical protein R3F43_30125 [bacterium]